MSSKIKTTRRMFAASSLVVSMGMGLPATAGDWQITPSIYTSVLHSDNLGLQPDEVKQSGQSYELSPQIVVNKEGQRFRLNSNYRLQMRRAGGSFDDMAGGNRLQADQNFHSLNLATEGLLVSDQLGFTGNANISQQVISRAVGTGVTTGSGLGNVTDIGTYSIEPFFNFKRAATSS